MTVAYEIVSSPAPPYSVGIILPKRPSFAIFSSVFVGYSSFLSSSAAIGATSFSANSRTMFLIIFCCSFNSNCIRGEIKFMNKNLSLDTFKMRRNHVINHIFLSKSVK